MMKIEPLRLFTTFTSPTLSVRSARKVHNIEAAQDPQVGRAVAEGGIEANLRENLESGCGVKLFTPYSAKLPWHTGGKLHLSRLFPRYGNYCGPNWSSGREEGSLMWDVAPIDALDFCCYKHDMGYDSLEQEDLLRADLSFMTCLERIAKDGRSPGKSPLAEPYRNVYIFGLQNFMIPYRKYLLQKVDEKTRKRLAMDEHGMKDTQSSKHMS